MNEKKHIDNLFDHSGCLSFLALQKYQTGELTGEEKKIVEEHLSDCDFCRDAMEGAGYSKDMGKFADSLNEIERNVDYSVKRRTKLMNTQKRAKRIRLRYTYLSLAASVAIVIGIFSYLVLTRDSNRNTYADQMEDYSDKLQKELADDVIEKPTGELTDSNLIAYVEEERQESENLSESGGSAEEAGEISPAVVGGVAVATGEGEQKISYELNMGNAVPDSAIEISGDIIDVTEIEAEEDIALALEGVETGKEEADEIPVAMPEMAKKETKSRSLTDVLSPEKIYTEPEEMPRFEWRDIKDFQLYIEKKIKYPREAKDNGISGTVYVKFIINTDGNVSDVIVDKPVDPLLDDEAKRIISSSPKWIPGKQNGEPVRVSLIYPVKFSLK